MGARVPVPPERGAHAQADLDLVSVERPLQRRAQVVVLLLQPLEPGALLGADQLGFAGLGQLEEEAGVPRLDMLRLSTRGQALSSELADGFQHREAWLAPRSLVGPQQALLGERAERVQNIGRRRAGV